MKNIKKLLFKIIINCIFLLLPAAPAFCADNQGTAESGDRPNIILITVDALRADHLSCYGYSRSTSPNIDRIAKKGVVFKNVAAPSSWTVPSIVSLFTSAYSVNHGVIHGFSKNKGNKYKQEIFSKKLVTLTEILKANGYTTFAVASNLHLKEKFGFSRGFDYFKCLSFSPADVVNAEMFKWKNRIKGSDRFFLWVHYFDPHAPYHLRSPWIKQYAAGVANGVKKYTLPADMDKLSKLTKMLKQTPRKLNNLISAYDSEINYADFHIEKLLQEFKTDNTLIVITSDHGEEFVDHDWIGHGATLKGESINIPLIIKLPDAVKQNKILGQASLLDIMPTVLCSLKLPTPENVSGRNLFGENNQHHVYSELDTFFDLKAIITPEWKYIYEFNKKSGQLYNLKTDIKELQNLAAEKPEKSAQMRKLIFDWVQHARKYSPEKRSIKLSPEEQEKLKSLGYIE